jgi:PAS domain S-box-containing protein
MKGIIYYILAGILLISLVFIKSVLPLQSLHFTFFSLPVMISPLFTSGVVWLVMSVVIISVSMHVATQFFSASKTTSKKIFDEPPVETISTAYISLKWRCIKVNKMCCELLGYDARQLLKMDFQRLIHPDDFKNDLPSIRKISDGQQQTHQSQQRYLDKNGDLVFLSVTLSLKRAKDGKPLYFVCQFQKPHTLNSAASHSYDHPVYSTPA